MGSEFTEVDQAQKDAADVWLRSVLGFMTKFIQNESQGLSDRRQSSPRRDHNNKTAYPKPAETGLRGNQDFAALRTCGFLALGGGDADKIAASCSVLWWHRCVRRKNWLAE